MISASRSVKNPDAHEFHYRAWQKAHPPINRPSELFPGHLFRPARRLEVGEQLLTAALFFPGPRMRRLDHRGT